MNGRATIIRADARALPLADASVDLVVTSPPYFALRAYQDAGEHYDGQLGSEATPDAYLDGLIACTREMMRVLKPAGSIWLNLGDKYAGSIIGGQTTSGLGAKVEQRIANIASRKIAAGFGSVRSKSLMGLPWRYALRCIDELGLILRAEVIWSKPNGLPESVTDRVRRSHEQWFHFVKQPRYFSAVDTVREPLQSASIEHDARRRLRTDTRLDLAEAGRASTSNPLGKLPGSVWDIPTQPLTVPEHLGVDHFAAFPVEWPRRIILGWSPSGICVVCGDGRRPMSVTEYVNDRRNKRPELRTGFDRQNVAHRKPTLSDGPGATTITGESCGCPEPNAPTRPAVVLDPFGGTGTTALAAKALGRHGISVDMSADYCRIAAWRTSDPCELARALGVPRPPVEVDGQQDLFAFAGVGETGQNKEQERK